MMAEKRGVSRASRGAGANRREGGDRGARTSRAALFFQASIPDFLLVLMVSVALTFTVSYGFYSAAAYRGDVPFIAVASLPLLVILFAGSWSKRALIPSALGVVVLAGTIIGISVAATPADVGVFVDGGYHDVEDNYVAFGFLLAVVPVVVYLLSRRMVGLVVLLFFAVLACGSIQFLYREWTADQAGLFASVTVLLGIAVMFVYQCYKQSVYQAKRIKSTAFAGAFAFSVLIGVACVLVGVAVYFGIIANLGLSTPEIKPFERYVAHPELVVSGTIDEFDQRDEELTSDDLSESERDSSQDAEGGNRSDSSDSSGEAQGSPRGGLAQLLSAFDVRNWDPEYNPIGYLILQWSAIVLLVFIPLVLIVCLLLWRYRRTLRLKRLEKEPYPYRVWYLYGFLLERLGRLKMPKPDYLTPLEFALGARRAMLPFAQGTGDVDFVVVTNVYQRVCYGGCDVGKTDYDCLVTYYRAFFKNARRHVGGLKWLWKFWRI
jgi:hypothetical protein